MAKKIKISRKQLKKPDEFLTRSERAWDWAEEHVWEIAGAVAAVAVLFLLAQGVVYWLRQRAEEPKIAMAEALEIMKKPVMEGQEEIIPGIDAGFMSEDEKYEAAVHAFGVVIKEHPETVQSRLAFFYLGRAYENLGRYDEAISSYQSFLDTEIADRKSSLNHSAILGVGRSLYSLGKYDEALEKFELIIESDSAFKPEAMNYAARCYKEKNELEKAAVMLKRLKDEYRDHWIARPSDFLVKYWREHQTFDAQGFESSDQKSMELEEEFILEPGEE